MTDLFANVGYDGAKFREAITMLQLVPPREMEQWKSDPTAGLPARKSDDEDWFFFLNEEQLEALPEPECLVDEILLSGGVTLLTGRENLGKSALAIAMGASVSLGIPWCGQPTKAGLVFYIAAEGANGINKRLKAWKQSMNIPSTPNFRVLPMSVQLHEPIARERLIKSIDRHTLIAREQAVAQGLEVPELALVIVDTLAKTRGTLDENSQSDMTLYLEGLNEFKERVGPAFLVLHHNNKLGEFRGSSALTANADGHLLLIGESGGSQIVLKVAKLKDFADGQQYVLRKQVVDLGVGKNGKPQTSVVFERDLEAEAELRAESGEDGDEFSPKEKTVFRVLGGLQPATGESGVSSAVWLRAAEKEGVAVATFNRAKKKLVEAGAVNCEKPGTMYVRFAVNPEFKM